MIIISTMNFSTIKMFLRIPYLWKSFFIPECDLDRGNGWCFDLAECNVCLCSDFNDETNIEIDTINTQKHLMNTRIFSKEMQTAFECLYYSFLELTLILMEKCINYEKYILARTTYRTILSNTTYDEILKISIWFLTYEKLYNFSYVDIYHNCVCKDVCKCKDTCTDNNIKKFVLIQLFACMYIISFIRNFDFKNKKKFDMFVSLFTTITESKNLTIGEIIFTSTELFPNAEIDFTNFYKHIVTSITKIEEEVEAKRVSKAEAEVKDSADADTKSVAEAVTETNSVLEAEAEAKSILEAEAKQLEKDKKLSQNVTNFLDKL